MNNTAIELHHLDICRSQWRHVIPQGELRSWGICAHALLAWSSALSSLRSICLPITPCLFEDYMQNNSEVDTGNFIKPEIIIRDTIWQMPYLTSSRLQLNPIRRLLKNSSHAYHDRYIHPLFSIFLPGLNIIDSAHAAVEQEEISRFDIGRVHNPERVDAIKPDMR